MYPIALWKIKSKSLCVFPRVVPRLSSRVTHTIILIVLRASSALPGGDRGQRAQDARAEEHDRGARGRDCRIAAGSGEQNEAGRRGAHARAERAGDDRESAAQHQEARPRDRAEEQTTGGCRERVSLE